MVGWWPWRRDSAWATLLRARALENGCAVLGCCVAGSEAPGERFAGAGNYAFGASGEPLGTPDDRSYEVPEETPADLLVDLSPGALEARPVKRFGE